MIALILLGEYITVIHKLNVYNFSVKLEDLDPHHHLLTQL
jgi:hypothetical protein